jgi:hypothetical protein
VVVRFFLFVLALVGLSAAAAFVTPRTSSSADALILAAAFVAALSSAVAAVWVTRNLFAAVAILPAVAAAMLIANFLPYLLGLWGHSLHDYASDDQTAAARLALLLAWSLLGTIAVSLAIGLIADATHLLLSRFYGRENGA